MIRLARGVFGVKPKRLSKMFNISLATVYRHLDKN